MMNDFDPYEVPEDIGGYGEDRIGCGPLTLVNASGLFLGMLASWKLTGWLGVTGPNFSPLWWLQVALIAGCGLAGVVLTIRFGGLALVERLFLWMLFQAERLSGRAVVTPHAPGLGRARTLGALPITRGQQLVSAPYHGKEMTDGHADHR